MSARRLILFLTLMLPVAGCEQRSPSLRVATKTVTQLDPSALAALTAARAEAEKEKAAYEARAAKQLADFDAKWQALKERANTSVTVTRAEAVKKTEDLKETLLRVAGETEARQRLERVIEQLRAQTTEAAEDADERLRDAEKARVAAEEQLRRVREASPDHWRETRSAMDQALEALNRTYARAVAAFPAT